MQQTVAWASMTFSWLKVSRTLFDKMVAEVNNMKEKSGSIKRCIESWRINYIRSLLKGDYGANESADGETISTLAACWLESLRNDEYVCRI